MRHTIVHFLLISTLQTSAMAYEPSEDAPSPKSVLRMLQDGNLRYLTEETHGWRDAADRREQFTDGQSPLACILTCSDSRVSPEILFDLSLGDLFVCRVAGNVVSPEVAGSVEYAVEHLGVSLVVVMGHTSCGAVKAAVESPEIAGPVASLVGRIEPAVEVCKLRGVEEPQLAKEAVSTHASMGCAALYESCPSVQEAIEEGKCMLVSAVYDIESGHISWETQLTSVSAHKAILSGLEEEIRESEQRINHEPSRYAEPNMVSQDDHESASREAPKKKVSKKPASRPRRY